MIRKELRIEKLGFLDLTIPYFEIGQDSPKIAILNGLHGIERTGAYLMALLQEKLKIRRGTMALIPFANPTSALQNTRLTPEDFQDLNRLFPGNPQGSLSRRLAHTLFSFLKDFDLTIDIHTFPKMQMGSVGVLFANAPQPQREKVLQLLQIFRPDYIWKLDILSGEKNKAGSLIEALSKVGKLAFSLEVPDAEFISDEQEKRFLDGLRRLSDFFLRGQKIKTRNNIPFITRTPACALQGGFFVPEVPPNTSVRCGERIGKIITLTDFKRIPIASPADGPVVFILHKTFVFPGERVALVGESTTL